MILSIFILAQNNCNQAVTISFEEYSSCGNMAITYITLDETINPSGIEEPNSCIPDSLNDYWLKLTVPDDITELSFHVFNSDYVPMIQGTSVPILEVYTGENCESLVLNDCFESDGGGPLQNSEIRWETLENLTPNETLYLRIADSSNIVQNIVVAVSEITEYLAYSCDNPSGLNSGICTILSDERDFPAPDDCGWTATDNAAFYQFEITSNGSYTFNLSGINHIPFPNQQSEPSTQAIILSNETTLCSIEYPYNCLYCFNSSDNSINEDIELEAGMYYMVVDGYSCLSGKSLGYGSISYYFTGNNPYGKERISIYPNPVSNVLKIDSPEGLNYEITNITGQKVLSGITDNTNLDLSKLESGVYIFRIIENGYSFIERIIVE